MKIFALDLENISPEIWISSYREKQSCKKCPTINMASSEFWEYLLKNRSLSRYPIFLLMVIEIQHT